MYLLKSPCPSAWRVTTDFPVLAEIWPVPRWWLRLPSPAASRLREAPPPSGFATGKKRLKEKEGNERIPGDTKKKIFAMLGGGRVGNVTAPARPRRSSRPNCPPDRFLSSVTRSLPPVLSPAPPPSSPVGATRLPRPFNLS